MSDGAGGPRLDLELLYERHPDPTFALDRDGRFVSGNAAFRRLVGRGPDELRSLTYRDLVHADDVDRIDREFVRVLAGEERTYRVRGIDPDGHQLELEVTDIPGFAVDGRVTIVHGIVRDVSDQAAVRAALEASELRFRGLFEGSGTGIAITALDGRYVDANPIYLDMLGYGLDELRSMRFLDVTHPDDRDANARRRAVWLASQLPSFVVEKRYVRRDGATVWVRARMSMIRDPQGRPTHVAATTEDITAARATGERLRRTEQLQRLAGQLARVGGWSIEASDRTVYWSDEVFRILDAPDGEAPRLEDAITLYPDESRERLGVAIDRCLTDGTPFDLELDIDTYQGRRILVRAIAEPQRGPDGSIERIIGAFQDVSALQAATREAEEAAARLTLTLESMTDAIYTLDRDWRFTYLNARAAELLRVERDAMLGRRVWDAFPEAAESPLYVAYHGAVETGRTEVIEEFHYPPLDTWFSVNAYPSEQGLAVYFRDVTADHRARGELERQAMLLDEAQDAIVVRRVDGEVGYWNRGAERLYGWSAAEAAGRDVRDLLYDDPTVFDRAMAALLAAGTWSGELRHRDRAGDELTVAARWTLLRDDGGRSEGVLSITSDVTDQRRTEQQLLRAQRMESIGTLAGGVAHDLNNVLAPILLATELLQTGDRAEEDAGLLETIQLSARRGADLVSQVLSFARGVEGERTSVDIAALLGDIRAIVRDTFPKDVRLSLVVADRLAHAVGDSTQIQQVVLNLAVNARDAMPDGGTITITATDTDLDEQHVAVAPGTAVGSYVLIEVEDEGTGMSAAVRDRIFEPFFTTKPQGSGTGLGLSTAAGIVRSHGGILNVYSEPGRGSRFRLYLPRDGGTAASPDGDGAALPRGADQTVLVVDDEAAVRAMTRQTLEAHGFSVIEAADGAEALALFVQHRDRIDVVLTDMMMPVMDGPATILALRRVDPDVRVIGASGLHGNGRVAKAGEAGARHFLPKPYDTRGLLEALATILAEDRPPRTSD